MRQRIVLLHATPVAMPPIHEAFQQLWPEAEIVNLLDDGLTIDRGKQDDLSPALIERFISLGYYAAGLETQGILITCSAFGPAIDQLEATLPLPVLKPNEAMFEAALTQGKRIGMLATFAPSVSTMTEEFYHYAQNVNPDATLETIVVPNAIDALRKGDVLTHNRLVAEAAPRLRHCDVIMLAHFSTSQAMDAVQAVISLPILSAPHSAVSKMKHRVQEAIC